MRSSAEAIKISENVYWVGAIDWEIRNFHGYNTSQGTTYNAYLILAEKNVLVDTVKLPFFDEMLARISSIIAPSEIDYIISNHSEMDHSGALIKTAEIIKPEKVFCSKNGAEALKKHLNPNFELTVVKTGDKIDLGGKTVSFIETRMLHWPDSMFTYLHEDRILFSQDAFGMHLASSERFYDKIDNYILETEAEKYYANILLPYSDLILKLLSQISSLNIDIKMIATDHGPIWRNNGICKILSLYEKWALQKPQNRAIIIFDTMWGSTTKMAEAISDGIIATGTEVKLMPLSANHRSDIATEQLNSGAILFGSPTLNNNIFPTMADLIFYLKGLRPKNKIGAAFGSYGWSGEATRQLDSFLKEMKFEIVSEPISVKYVPTRDELNKCFELGKKIAEKLKSLTQN
ncbi:MAG TPA: FprA family A-type flavoprotein, partial [Victivallales bacterium]|nr:FprA family A-type flavoprotein [Victivallales bacterium]HPO91407.1 FprA family A-type flavoprotein [Victivallales bacterium]HRR06284.1 FprA family A-type flavoprotein [Victivallales bacterium]HRU01124.1 FprA family A-type flavoprotein [Victivallales bacterium]